MGNRDVSIVFKASDKLSDSLRQMRRGVKSLESDVEHYKKLQQQVFQEKAQVKLDITQAKQNMKELEKAVRNGSEGARDAFLEQQTALESLNDEYKRLSNLQSEVLRGEKEIQTTMSRNSNANAGSGVGAGLIGAAGMMKSLAKAGLGSMLGGAVGDLMGGMATSAFGSTVGGAIAALAAMRFPVRQWGVLRARLVRRLVQRWWTDRCNQESVRPSKSDGWSVSAGGTEFIQ